MIVFATIHVTMQTTRSLGAWRACGFLNFFQEVCGRCLVLYVSAPGYHVGCKEEEAGLGQGPDQWVTAKVLQGWGRWREG